MILELRAIDSYYGLGHILRGLSLAVTEGEVRSPILVGQSYFRADDRWEWDGAEQREKYIDGELLVGVVYQCQVVVTNPTSRSQKLAVLLQIPRGAMPVAGLAGDTAAD